MYRTFLISLLIVACFLPAGLAAPAGRTRLQFSGKTAPQLAAAGITPMTMMRPLTMPPQDWAGAENPGQPVIIEPARDVGFPDTGSVLVSTTSWGGGVRIPMQVRGGKLYRARIHARALRGWLNCYATPAPTGGDAGSALSGAFRQLGSTGVLRPCGWRTYEFEFVILPDQKRAFLAVTNWQAGTFLLDWADFQAIADLPKAKRTSHSGQASLGPAETGQRRVWVFDEPGFPERAKADAAFWVKALRNAGHQVSKATVANIVALEKSGRADVDVVVFPNRGFLPADGEPGILSFLARGGAVIIGGSLATQVGGTGGELPPEMMERIYSGQLRPEQTRIPGGKWLRRNSHGNWSTPWRAYCLKVFPYACNDFQIGVNYPPYTAPREKDLPPGAPLVPASWLVSYGIPFPPQLITKQWMSALLPLDWVGRPGHARFIPTQERRDNVYLGLYVPDPKKAGGHAFSDAFIVRYHSRLLPAGTLVHLGQMADEMLSGPSGAAVAAGLVSLACQPKLPGEKAETAYSLLQERDEAMEKAAKDYFAAEDYLKDHLDERATNLPPLTRTFHRMLLLNRIADKLEDAYPVVYPRAADAFLRSLSGNRGKKPPMNPSLAAALRQECIALARRLEQQSQPWAARNSPARLATPWKGRRLIFGGDVIGGGGFRHLDRLARNSSEIGFEWVGRDNTNEQWMPRVYAAYRTKTYVGFGYFSGFGNPLLYSLSDSLFRKVTGFARLFRDRPYITAHATSCELMPNNKTKQAARYFRSWLKGKYHTLGAVNAAWRTAYKSWDNIAPPAAPPKAIGTPDHAIWEDYTVSTERLFEDFHRRMSESLREGDPDRAVISQFHLAYGTRVQQGLHRLRLHQYEDLEGTHEDAERNDWLSKGIMPAPLCDEEWHAILYARGDSLDNCFRCWERMGIEAAQGQVGWIVFPYVRYEEFRGGLFDTTGHPHPGAWGFKYLTRRLQRLGELCARGENAQARVAMLHSDTAFRHTGHLDSAYDQERTGWYTLLGRAGVPLRVIDETQVTVRFLQAFDVLLVPYAPYLPTNLPEAIEAYASAGGAVVLQTPGLPAFDSYRRPRPLFGLSDVGKKPPPERCVLPLGKAVYQTWRHADRFRVTPEGTGWQATMRYAEGEPAVSRRSYGRGSIVLIGAPAALDIGGGWRDEALRFLPLLRAVGIDHSFRQFRILEGSAFVWLRVLHGRTYLWCVCGDAPEAIVFCKLALPEVGLLRDILTNEAIPCIDGVAAFRVPAPGVRVFVLQR